MRQGKKRRPFIALPRSRRSREGVKLRQKIKRDQELFGGRFYSHAELNPESNLINNQWFDFLFTGQRKHEIWNAEIITARLAFWEKVDSIAFERTHAQLSAEEREKEFSYISTRLDNGYYRREKKFPMIQYPQFDGLTYRDYLHQLERKILTSEPPEIYESFQLDYSYRHGVGLHIVVDAEAVSYSLIDQSIDRFLALGQKAWRSAIPVSRERLPFETEHDVMLSGQMAFPSLPVRENF